jgi:molecular chaperone DnaK
MGKTIDFAIDLGTTNSLIARFNKGEIEIFKNPKTLKENLPSVVGFRKERVLIGDQAKTFAPRQPKDVKSRFKRKMGTTESFQIPSINQSKTPVELSAFILKELKTFIYTGEIPEAAVITIPASFDAVQSNATKESGHLAGFRQVVLLQEPIAASLAYANKTKDYDLKNSQWLVYDLGGGTFDVALVKIVEGELRIIDHEGDNYLGGTDFDAAIISEIIVPYLEKEGSFNDLLGQMKSASGKYNRLWETLLLETEEAKIFLSSSTSADIEFEVEDDEGQYHEILMTITRSDFGNAIRDYIDSTSEMIKAILTRNSLQSGDIGFVLMVGGSTYIPLARQRIGELLQIPVNCDFDPTTAVVVGAAHFAATREVTLDQEKEEITPTKGSLRVRVAYNRTSQEEEELFSAKAEGDIENLFFRITREDGGYDSGLIKLNTRISEDLPLQEDAYNLFSFKVFDQENNPVDIDVDIIQIAQGKFGIAGQMLPEDISLVLDDLVYEDTRLDCLFQKNSILPAKFRRTVDVDKTLIHGSDDEIRIIVVEGPSENHFTANKIIGHLIISGGKIARDVLQGTEIDLSFEMSESRELAVSAYVNASGQEFSQIFTPEFRDVPIQTLTEEIDLLAGKLNEEIEDAQDSENYEAQGSLSKLCQPMQSLQGEALLLSVDDVTDDRYKLEDRKRVIAQEISVITSTKRLERVRAQYQETKEDCLSIVNGSGNDHERRAFNEIIAQEHIFIDSSNPQKIEARIDELSSLRFSILQRIPAFLVSWFNHLIEKRERFNDQIQAKSLIEAGRIAIESESFDRLSEINFGLLTLLPESDQVAEKEQAFTGIR